MPASEFSGSCRFGGSCQVTLRKAIENDRKEITKNTLTQIAGTRFLLGPSIARLWGTIIEKRSGISAGWHRHKPPILEDLI